MRQDRHVGSREISGDDSRRGDRNNVQVAADQSFRADAGAHDRDDLGVEPILFKQLTFFDDEGDYVSHPDGRHTDANLLERFSLRKNRLGESQTDQRKQSSEYGLSSSHDKVSSAAPVNRASEGIPSLPSFSQTPTTPVVRNYYTSSS